MKMFKKLIDTYRTGDFFNGFCSEGESVQFKIDVYSTEGGFEPIISYTDSFNLELGSPISVGDEEVSIVSKTVEIQEEFLFNHPSALKASSVEVLLEMVQERILFHGFTEEE